MFVTLYDENTLKLYLNRGLYGFLMKPTSVNTVSSRSKHYAVLADYACSREGTDLFFFLKRKIVYGGKIYGNTNCASFYINGQNSPLGQQTQANLFWDESSRYTPTTTPGIFKVNGADKAQPFIFQFHQTENTGKYIISDDLYFNLGKKYPYPLPSNSMQGMSFCTLTPGEVEELIDLLSNSDNRIDFTECDDIEKNAFLMMRWLTSVPNLSMRRKWSLLFCHLSRLYMNCLKTTIFFVGKFPFLLLSRWIWIEPTSAYIVSMRR